MRCLGIICFYCLPLLAIAQTITTTDINGNTIVGVLTTDTNGNPTTQVLSTVVPGVPNDPGQQGPVGAAPVTPTGTDPPTYIYTYTTTDAAGNTERFTEPFIPTYIPPPGPPTTIQGSIWALSDYTKQFGTAIATHKSSAPSQASLSWRTPLFALAFTLVGIFGGAIALPVRR